MTEPDLRPVEALARSMAAQGKDKAKNAFHAFAMRQGWHGTPTWLTARARFMAAYRRARQPILDRQARNEWRANARASQQRMESVMPEDRNSVV